MLQFPTDAAPVSLETIPKIFETVFDLMLQVSEAGIHRPHVSGIHGRDSDGAYSIVLAGGYEDDLVSYSVI